LRRLVLRGDNFPIIEGLIVDSGDALLVSFAAMNLLSIKPLAVAAGLMLAISACNKKSDKPCPPVTTAAPADEVSRLEQHLTTANITATKDERGFYYNIKNAGSGEKPNACSTVKVAYKGRLTNGEEFDSSNGVEFPLQDLIAGWQEGIPLIAPGGSVTLYLPPSLAYGSSEQQGIPANSILVFDIDLLSVE
jgi:FKBP-type peptidyl-prolyl cis-trans isomerase FkpA